MKVSLLAVATGLALSANFALAQADVAQPNQTALQPNSEQNQTASAPADSEMYYPGSGPYDPDAYAGPEGFPLSGWAQLKLPID